LSQCFVAIAWVTVTTIFAVNNDDSIDRILKKTVFNLVFFLAFIAFWVLPGLLDFWMNIARCCQMNIQQKIV